MALTDKLTAIADGFRASRKITEKLSLDEMAVLAAENTEQNLRPLEYPDYVRAEINRVADEVRKVLKNESFVSICLSDSHYPADTNTKMSGLHAMMAIKGLAYLLPVDYIAHLGDVGFEGNSSTTTEALETNISEMLTYVKESAGDSVPLFVAIGNHDSGNYITTDVNDDMLSGEYLYNNFTALSASDDTVFSGEENGGYCYRDFIDKKIRVFLLNTSEEIITGGYSNDNGTSETQRAWFASKLQELNTKSDASEWGIVVLCHYPADYGAARPLSNLLAAYVNGTSITLNGVTFNFSNSNAAKFIVQHHGHIHNFLADRLYTGSTPVQYNAWRVGIPNTQDNRDNYYGEFGGIQYSETTTYTKVPGTVEDTSFVVNVINPSEEKVYSFYYGKGYNRVIGYGSVTYYGVSRNLTNATTNSTIFSVEEGQAYSETITLNTGCEIKSISVTMGGVDISATAITAITNGYKISIPEVNGDVMIIVKAQGRPNFTNLVPLSVNTDGTDYVVDGDGYDNDTYITSSGTLAALSGYVSTGYIPVTAGTKTIRITGDNIFTDIEYTRVAVYDSNFANPAVEPLKNMGTSIYHGTLTEEETTAMTWTVDTTNMPGHANAPYIRISTKGDGADLVVTVNEEITYGGSDEGDAIKHTVNYNVSNATSSNKQSFVEDGAAFSTTLTAHGGFEIDSVTVTMGGTNITSSAYNSSTGVISISKVTGNVVITVTTIEVKENLLTSAIDTSGAVFNGTGYKSGFRLSTSDGGERTLSGSYISGFIPVVAGQTITLKNVGTAAVSGTASYLIWFKSLRTNDLNRQLALSTISTNSDGSLTITLDEATHGGDHTDVQYFRLSCSYLGADTEINVE